MSNNVEIDSIRTLLREFLSVKDTLTQLQKDEYTLDIYDLWKSLTEEEQVTIKKEFGVNFRVTAVASNQKEYN